MPHDADVLDREYCSCRRGVCHVSLSERGLQRIVGCSMYTGACTAIPGIWYSLHFSSCMQACLHPHHASYMYTRCKLNRNCMEAAWNLRATATAAAAEVAARYNRSSVRFVRHTSTPRVMLVPRIRIISVYQYPYAFGNGSRKQVSPVEEDAAESHWAENMYVHPDCRSSVTWNP